MTLKGIRPGNAWKYAPGRDTDRIKDLAGRKRVSGLAKAVADEERAIAARYVNFIDAGGFDVMDNVIFAKLRGALASSSR